MQAKKRCDDRFSAIHRQIRTLRFKNLKISQEEPMKQNTLAVTGLQPTPTKKSPTGRTVPPMVHCDEARPC